MPKNTSTHTTNVTKRYKIADVIGVNHSKSIDELSPDGRLLLELLVMIVDIRYRHKYKRGEDES